MMERRCLVEEEKDGLGMLMGRRDRDGKTAAGEKIKLFRLSRNRRSRKRLGATGRGSDR